MISDNAEFTIVVGSHAVHNDVTNEKYIDDPVEDLITSCLRVIVEGEGNRSVDTRYNYKAI